MRADNRIHRALVIEELEARVAPTVDILNPAFVGATADFQGDTTAPGDADALVLSVSGGNIAHNLLAIVTAILVLGGIQFIAIGFVMTYMFKVMTEIKKELREIHTVERGE